MSDTATPSPPIPFPSRPGVRPPVEPLPLRPVPTPGRPAPARPQPDPGDKGPLPAAARAMPDPLGLIRLATIHAEQAEQCRVLGIEHAAILVDQTAISVASGPAETLTREQVVTVLSVLAQHVRAIKTPGAPLERAGGPA